ncbi:MAG TPA: hypothetical protein VFJ84_03140 [Candidatus Saccharimonadales bacterium]|nr:hypothetical protein [Candidatus Saccharimonadales bacterium]
MERLKRSILSLAAVLLFSGVAMAAPAAARATTNDTNSTNSTDSTDSTDSTGAADNSTQDSAEAEKSGNDLAEQFRMQAKEKVRTEREQAREQHSAEARQKSCTARKNALTNRMTNSVRWAKQHKQVFDNIYTQVQNFYSAKQLDVTNYTTLKAAADVAQTNADASIVALQSTDISIDCTAPDVASAVSAFQSAIGSTRDTLKAYRAALVDLVKALKGASTANSTSNAAGNTTNTANQ